MRILHIFVAIILLMQDISYALAPESAFSYRQEASNERAIAKLVETKIENNGIISKGSIRIGSVVAILRQNEKWLAANGIHFDIAESQLEVMIKLPSGGTLRYFDNTELAPYPGGPTENLGAISKQFLIKEKAAVSPALVLKLSGKDDTEERLRVYAFIDDFIMGNHGILADKEKSVDDVLTELIFNVMEHGKGGTVEVRIEGEKLNIIASDKGSGLPADPNEMTKRSLTVRNKAREYMARKGTGESDDSIPDRGYGFSRIALDPDSVTIEYGGRRFIRDRSGQYGWFREEGTTDVVKGTRFTMEFLLANGIGNVPLDSIAPDTDRNIKQHPVSAVVTPDTTTVPPQAETVSGENDMNTPKPAIRPEVKKFTASAASAKEFHIWAVKMKMCVSNLRPLIEKLDGEDAGRISIAAGEIIGSFLELEETGDALIHIEGLPGDVKLSMYHNFVSLLQWVKVFNDIISLNADSVASFVKDIGIDTLRENVLSVESIMEDLSLIKDKFVLSKTSKNGSWLIDSKASIAASNVIEQTVLMRDSVMLGRLNEWFYKFKGVDTFKDAFTTAASTGSPLTRDEADRFARQLDQMQQHNALPNEIVVYEIGCGNGRYAGEFLSRLREIRPQYYEKINYIICDFSQKMLEGIKAGQYIAPHLDKVSFVQADATKELPFTKPALMIRCNELLDDLMPMQLVFKEADKFYDMTLEMRIKPDARFVTRDGVIVPQADVVRWIMENNMDELSRLDPSFISKIEAIVNYREIADITSYPYGEYIGQIYRNMEYAEIPINIGAIDFVRRAVKHLYPEYGQLVAYDYGIYRDSITATNTMRRFHGQPTMDVNFLLLERIVSELPEGFSAEVRKQPNTNYPDGLNSILDNGEILFYRLQILAPVAPAVKEKSTPGVDLTARPFATADSRCRIDFQTRPIADNERILLSESLFMDGANREELEDIFLALRPILNKPGSHIEILDEKDIMERVTNAKSSKDKVAAILSQEDKDNNRAWSDPGKAESIKATVLFVDNKLTGANYLYLTGLIGFTRAVMAQDRDKVSMYYKLLTGDDIKGEVLKLLDISGSKNTIPFALNLILRFRPITKMDPAELDALRVAMETFLISA